MKIFLGDVVHNWEKVGNWTFPVNVGYVASYAKSLASEDLEIRLFKDPQLMADAIKKESPDVVALAYYVWNINLNNWIFEITKSHNPNTLTVGGGPCFTNINANIAGANKFRSEQNFCDAYVINQGERGFLKIVERFLSVNASIEKFLSDPLDGVILFPANREPFVGALIDPLKDLDDIPSPYLSGMLDEFFDGPYGAILETNRSCPYRCTFCAWGIGTQKLSRFSEERVTSEIDYISRRMTQSISLYIGDANFGILERDAVFAQKMRDCFEEFGYPAHVNALWNKTRPDRVFNAAKILGSLSEVGASMQSLNPATLKAIKRKNLPLEAVVGIVEELQSDNVDMTLFTELILGLPEETTDTHIYANKKMMDLGAEIYNYNLHLLPGTEMDNAEYRQEYIRKTGYRLHENCYGMYGGKKIFEGQEVVLETPTMTTEELRSFRFIHFLLQFMWSRKWYIDFLKLFKSENIHPFDVILAVAESAKKIVEKLVLYIKSSARITRMRVIKQLKNSIHFGVKKRILNAFMTEAMESLTMYLHSIFCWIVMKNLTICSWTLPVKL